MLQISRRTDYAVRIMTELGLHTEDTCMPSRLLSKRTGVPKAFLHKITADLVKANLVRTFSGPSGGLKLAQSPADVTLLHVVEAIEGQICLNVCLARPHECPRDHICAAHALWGQMQTMIVDQLQQMTLADLVQESKALRQQPIKFRDDIPYLMAE